MHSDIGMAMAHKFNKKVGVSGRLWREGDWEREGSPMEFLKSLLGNAFLRMEAKLGISLSWILV
jgi:hypothetical protein